MNDNVARFPAKKPVFVSPVVDLFHEAANAHYQCAQAHDTYINVLRGYEIGSGNDQAFEQMTKKLAEEESAAVEAGRAAFGEALASWPEGLQALEYLRAEAIEWLQTADGAERVQLHAFLVHIHRALAVTMVRENIIVSRH